ncbi:mycofactocin biosynthesis peptidyl-dipeptidase MftE [Spiractinospora alimapuensis]|uniref:mycofactocin biosynthesis peptidyl-dipeptidase MftE n=1 Tax=Spiractinospora alimapuensis TaxID=2820884 RepID=UPI001F24F17A|nr:mycofactocin biosynthesis peptidyl-dipeptidase MftE [Spiractinospora alimapuensis]QVQ53890.1 mycofactocin biosynthesis peptidyl-dipeptidase MftE [Spiractinospora alimapuensis]
MTELANLSWPDVDQRPSDTVLVVPVGSTEQHGPHLPLSTDTDIAEALCQRLAATATDVLVAPPVAYGASGEHAGFPGTLSIGTEALTVLLVELGRSATETFRRLLLVSAHGGNAAAVARATETLRSESRDVLSWSPRWRGDAHAGRVETSLQLALAPERVATDHAHPGALDPIADLMPTLRAHGVRAVSPNGVLGDPTEASAAEGERVLARLAEDLTSFVAQWPR